MVSFKGFSRKTMFMGMLSIAIAIVVFACTPPVVDDTNGGTTADTIAPTVAITSPVSNISINSNTYNIEGTASDAVGVKNVYIKIDGGVFVSLGATTSYSTNTSLSEGTNTISVYADDAAGNISTTNSRVITVNTGAPVIIFTEPATSPYTTNSNSIDIGGTADVSGALTAATITDIAIKTNGGVYSTLTNGGSNVVAWSTNNFALAEGTNTITVRAISDNDKTNEDSITVILDTTPPSEPVVNGNDSADTTPTWSWNTIGDAVKYRYSFVDGSGWTETNITNFTPTTNLAANTTNTLYVQACDAANNWSTSGNNTIVVMPIFTEINPTSLIGVSESSIDLGDIDGDGDLDLILTGYTNGATHVSEIYTNNGSGSFGKINSGTLTGVRQSSIKLGDINGNGTNDLILTGYSSSRISEIYTNDGNGSFTEINSGLLTGVNDSSIALGDIDSDGDLDLILTGNSGTSVSEIYTNDGNGSFGEINSGTLTGVRFSSIALGDINGNGTNDLILTGYNGAAYISQIYTNNGSGSFTEINTNSITNLGYGSIDLGDIDSDGNIDLILTGHDGIFNHSQIYQNDGSGSFTEINSGSLVKVMRSSIKLGDIDGDSDLDLILTGDIGIYISRIYQNDGSGSFSEINSGLLTAVTDSSIALGDIDGDGDLDLILTGWEGSICVSKIYRNNTIN